MIQYWHSLFQFLPFIKPNLPEIFDTVTKLWCNHDFPNSHIPGFNFLESLLNALSTTSHNESAN